MKSRVAQLVLGAAIIVLGLYVLSLLGQKLAVTSALGQYWPMLLIFVGVIAIGSNSEHIGIPLGIMGVGIVLLLDRLGLFASVQWLESAIFILIGFAVIATVFSGGSGKSKESKAATTHDRVID
ncbi:hypothetical protein HYX70_02060 [Candidatus Saccharibacteria bacterium]|nr:hypothetical protein [Candidatus Saccharibacteria bacterium]